MDVDVKVQVRDQGQALGAYYDADEVVDVALVSDLNDDASSKDSSNVHANNNLLAAAVVFVVAEVVATVAVAVVVSIQEVNEEAFDKN